MKAKEDTKLQIQIVATAVLLSVGIALVGQWLFNMCFVNETDTNKKLEKNIVVDTLKVSDSVRIAAVDAFVQRQK